MYFGEGGHLGEVPYHPVGGGGSSTGILFELKTRDPKEEDSQVEWSYYTTFTQGEVDLASRLGL